MLPEHWLKLTEIQLSWEICCPFWYTIFDRKNEELVMGWQCKCSCTQHTLKSLWNCLIDVFCCCFSVKVKRAWKQMTCLLFFRTHSIPCEESKRSTIGCETSSAKVIWFSFKDAAAPRSSFHPRTSVHPYFVIFRHVASPGDFGAAFEGSLTQH